jgi:hypothetical protein
MGQPVHKFLEEFPSEGAQPPATIVHRLRPRAVTAPQTTSPMGARLAEAYAKGFEEGQAVARTQAESELAALRADVESRLEEAKGLFSQAVTAQLTGQLHHRMEQLHAVLADQVGSALVPVLRHALTEASIRELADAMRRLARDGDAVTITLSGPEELVEQVWRRYRKLEGGQHADFAPEVRFIHDPTAEIRVSVNDAVIESRLMEWIARISEAVG